MKNMALVCSLMSVLVVAHADEMETAPPPPQAPSTPTLSPSSGAMIAAGTDGVSTLIGVSSGALVEANPIMPSTPAGIVVTTALKIALGYYADKLESPQREAGLKATTAVFGGATVNNLMLLASAGPVAAAIAGGLACLLLWHSTDERLVAEKHGASALARERAPIVSPIVQSQAAH